MANNKNTDTSLTAGSLRSISISTRHASSASRLQRYNDARDEAFKVLIENINQKMIDAANSGRFEALIYSFKNGKSDSEVENSEDNKSEEKEVQTRFSVGSRGDDDKGLHIMTLLSPTGIPREQRLIEHINTYLNESIKEDSNKVRTYFRKNPKNPSQWGVWVSWDNKVRKNFSGRSRGRGNFRGRGSGRGRGNGRVSPMHTSAPQES